MTLLRPTRRSTASHQRGDGRAYRAGSRVRSLSAGSDRGAWAGRGGLMLILDAGAFIAAERGNKSVAALVKRERQHGRAPLTNGSVVAQVWRGGTRQGTGPALAKLLAGSVESRSRLMILGRARWTTCSLPRRAPGRSRRLRDLPRSKDERAPTSLQATRPICWTCPSVWRDTCELIPGLRTEPTARPLAAAFRAGQLTRSPSRDEEAVVGEVVAAVDRGAVLAADHAQRRADPAGFRVVVRPGGGLAGSQVP